MRLKRILNDDCIGHIRFDYAVTAQINSFDIWKFYSLNLNFSFDLVVL